MQSVTAEETVRETAPSPQEKLFTKLQRMAVQAKPYAKAVMGAAAFGLGIWVAAPVLDVIGLAIGGLTSFTGARWMYEAAREALPAKTQTAIARFFTRKDIDVQPKKPSRPKTFLGHAVRMAEYMMLPITGTLSFMIGAFAVTIGGGLGASALFWGGPALIAAGAVAASSHVVRTVMAVENDAANKMTVDVAKTPAASQTPDLSPKPALVSRAEAGFNTAANGNDAAAAKEPVVKTEAAKPASPAA